MERENNPKMIGEYVSLKTRMSAGDAHYAGELVEGAHIVTAWGDVGTELAIRLFGDESLFVGYSEVRYTAPVFAGDWMDTADTSKRLVTLPLLANSLLTSG